MQIPKAQRAVRLSDNHCKPIAMVEAFRLGFIDVYEADTIYGAGILLGLCHLE
jgi:hypothetical protein